MSEIIRTPDSRFTNIPDYPFEPHYLMIQEGLRMHYVDEGIKSAPIVLLLHGEPTWSFLYRKMIPTLVDAGFRVIAPDLIGFGKSDKYTDQSAYSYRAHLNWLRLFIEQMDLTDIHLFCQDWGGLLGLRLLTEIPDRFGPTVVSNTTLPNGMRKAPDAFHAWQDFALQSPEFKISNVIKTGVISHLTQETLDAYDAPFPDESYKAGARIFPSLVPTEANDPEALNNREAWKFLSSWEKPMLTLFGTKDFMMQGAEKGFLKIVPGTKGQAHQLLEAGHFIQEDKGEELSKLMIAFFQKTL